MPSTKRAYEQAERLTSPLTLDSRSHKTVPGDPRKPRSAGRPL